MKNLIIISFLLLLGSNGYSQDYIRMSKEDIKSIHLFDFPKEFSDSTSYFKDIPGGLFASLGGYDKLNASYFFDNTNLSDSIYLEYYCSDCSDKNLSKILHDKKYKWIMIDSTTYISKKAFSAEIGFGGGNTSGRAKMVIVKTPNNPVCLSVEIFILERPKSYWKQLLKKKN